MADPQEIAKGDTPVVFTAERILHVLDVALEAAIDQRGDNAKAMAWDIRQHFLDTFGHHRKIIVGE